MTFRHRDARNSAPPNRTRGIQALLQPGPLARRMLSFMLQAVTVTAAFVPSDTRNIAGVRRALQRAQDDATAATAACVST